MAGIICMLLAAMLFVVMDSIAKYLGQQYPAPLLVWARFSLHTAIMLVYFAYLRRAGYSLMKSSAPVGQVLRGVLLFGATMFAYIAVRELPIAQVYVVNFSSPLLVTLLAVPILGERVGWRRAVAVCTGFAGIVIAIGPDRMSADAALLAPAAMALCFSLYQIATRRYGRDDLPLTSLFYSAAAGCVVSTFLLPFFWAPIAVGDIWLVLMLGILGASAHFSLIMAMRFAEASLVSPFLYSQLIWAAVIGAVVFSDPVTMRLIYGACLVIGAGIYIALRERRRDLSTRLST